MKSKEKNVVTLSMLWIAAMAIASQPGWVRTARDFVLSTTGHGVAAGGSAGSAGMK